MLKIKALPVLMSILSKIDIKPILKHLEEADIFSAAKSKSDAVEELKSEKAALLGFEIISEILPQLGSIGSDLITFTALYYDITPEAAEEKPVVDVINDIIKDKSIRDFFVTALQPKAELKS